MDTLADVLKVVSERTGLSADDLLSAGRRNSRDRWAVWLELRKLGWSFPKIGRAVGRHHATVIYGLERLGEPVPAMLPKTQATKAQRVARELKKEKRVAKPIPTPDDLWAQAIGAEAYTSIKTKSLYQYTEDLEGRYL